MMQSKRGVKPLCGVCRMPLHRKLNGDMECRRAACGRPTAKPRAKRATARRGPERDQSYMDWLKERKCVVCLRLKINWWQHVPVLDRAYYAIIDPAHTVNNGRGCKGPDSSCIPLCRMHHDEMDGRLSKRITTKEAFAAKYDLDLAKEAAAHWAIYQIDREATAV